MTTDNIYFDVKGTTLTRVFFRDNCSVYNPCGRNGYCYNNLNGEWTCVCKFWWNGTLCNEMSSNGRQVIAVGVMLFVLVVVFHGLKLFHRMRQKRKYPPAKKEKSNTSSFHRKLSATSNIEPASSRRILSLIIVIATLMLTAVTVIVKWRILQSIHDDIINKFKKKEPLFFQRHSICRVMDIRKEFNIITFSAACLLIVIFSLTSKRVSFQRGKHCRDYIGIPIPLDFFVHVKRTFSAMIFAIFADELFEIVNRMFGQKDSSKDEPEGIILTYLRQIFKVLVIGFRRYPTLAAIYIDTPFSLICASLYTWLDFGITIVDSGLCRNDFYSTEKNYNNKKDTQTMRYLNYYGTGSTLLFFQLLTDIPRYLFLSYISIKLFMLLCKRIRYRNVVDKQLSREQKNLLSSSLPNSVESCYVKNFLGMNNTNKSINRFRKTFRFIYAWRDDFRFSARVICIYAAIALLLFFITVHALIRIPPMLVEFQPVSQDAVNFFVQLFLKTDSNLQAAEDESSDFRLPDFTRPYLFAILFTVLVITIQLLVMLASIRRNMLQAFGGNYSEIPTPKSSNNASYVTGNFSFAGTLIGYVILGYVFLGFFSFIIVIIIGAFLTNGGSRFLENILGRIIPILLFVFFKTYLNKILSQYVFLQHKINVLSLNNRRVFMLFLYFNIFLDAFLGLFSAIIRLLKSSFGGILYMCRLDYSPLGRKLETKDSGFSAYCGFIYVECTHRHPVLLCFISHLLRDHLYGRSIKHWSRARHRWALAVLLLNNPTLIYQRKLFLSRSKENKLKMALIERQNGNETDTALSLVLSHRSSIDLQIELNETSIRERF